MSLEIKSKNGGSALEALAFLVPGFAQGHSMGTEQNLRAQRQAQEFQVAEQRQAQQAQELDAYIKKSEAETGLRNMQMRVAEAELARMEQSDAAFRDFQGAMRGGQGGGWHPPLLDQQDDAPRGPVHPDMVSSMGLTPGTDWSPPSWSREAQEAIGRIADPKMRALAIEQMAQQDNQAMRAAETKRFEGRLMNAQKLAESGAIMVPPEMLEQLAQDFQNALNGQGVLDVGQVFSELGTTIEFGQLEVHRASIGMGIAAVVEKYRGMAPASDGLDGEDKVLGKLDALMRDFGEESDLSLRLTQAKTPADKSRIIANEKFRASQMLNTAKALAGESGRFVAGIMDERDRARDQVSALRQAQVQAQGQGGPGAPTASTVQSMTPEELRAAAVDLSQASNAEEYAEAKAKHRLGALSQEEINALVAEAEGAPVQRSPDADYLRSIRNVSVGDYLRRTGGRN